MLATPLPTHISSSPPVSLSLSLLSPWSHTVCLPPRKDNQPGEREEREKRERVARVPPSPSFCSNRGAAPREIRHACPATSAAAEVSAALSTDPRRGAAPPLYARFGTRVWPGVPLPHSLTAAASAGSCGWTRSSGGSPVANWRSPVRGSGSGLGD
ncbi:hypothetical protein PVAP13_3NG258251 [Panicum virgatum]|uniref:Uncharacterized protein n=1 Tax=Panicum virgatum TaxID=38727 RepID=A0A8T0U862_PANVG|nr:hypothetical protein PVAP13_3NG258251 [Panicum virgatum]